VSLRSLLAYKYYKGVGSKKFRFISIVARRLKITGDVLLKVAETTRWQISVKQLTIEIKSVVN